uniref:Uncharacterized protein n=1 Tax=virus sp. ctnRj46 TaxID=2826814 RepID=A0A8S5R7U1_9VIRU|nr:MAG TPA: hypothetical protein [virus sp. ctnRj46]
MNKPIYIYVYLPKYYLIDRLCILLYHHCQILPKQYCLCHLFLLHPLHKFPK